MEPPNRGAKSRSQTPRGDLAAVWLSYGGRIPSGSGWVKTICPVHQERKPSATINIEEGAFKCFSCGAQGDVIALIRAIEDCTYQQALVKYKEIVGEDLTPGKNKTASGRPNAAESTSYEQGGWLASRLRRSNQ